MYDYTLMRITTANIAFRLDALNNDRATKGCVYDARRTGRLWVITMTPEGATMARTVADCLTSRECFAMLYGLLRGRQHQHDDRLRTVFGPCAAGPLTPAQPERVCCDHCAVGLTTQTAHFVECLSRDCASANAGESGTLCATCFERDSLPAADCCPITGDEYGMPS